uniref:Decapping nuclease n=1 Tax=Tetranychus urticae TaxID=32264 RepID=T1KUE3_TETUR
MSSRVQTESASVISEIHLDQLCQEKDENVYLQGTKILGYYSFYYDDQNKSVYCPDKSSLRYLDLPNPVYIDCLRGYSPYIKYGNKKPKGSNLLRWILENETIVRHYNYDFICNNGLLKEMMTVMHNKRDWDLCATKIRGQIVLNRVNSVEEKESIDARPEKENQSTYVANNLIRLITKNINHSHSTAGRKDDSFYGVFHTKIGSHRILHSGYLGCVASIKELDKPFEEMQFVLIKKYNTQKRKSHTPFHAITWWSLATLARVDTLVRAKCERDFTVKKIDKLKVQDLIFKHRQIVFFASLNMVLDQIKSTVTEENKCYRFSFGAKNKKMTGYMTDIDDNLIPSWYINDQLPVESQ